MLARRRIMNQLGQHSVPVEEDRATLPRGSHSLQVQHFTGLIPAPDSRWSLESAPAFFQSHHGRTARMSITAHGAGSGVATYSPLSDGGRAGPPTRCLSKRFPF